MWFLDRDKGEGDLVGGIRGLVDIVLSLGGISVY